LRKAPARRSPEVAGPVAVDVADGPEAEAVRGGLAGDHDVGRVAAAEVGAAEGGPAGEDVDPPGVVDPAGVVAGRARR